MKETVLMRWIQYLDNTSNQKRENTLDKTESNDVYRQ